MLLLNDHLCGKELFIRFKFVSFVNVVNLLVCFFPGLVLRMGMWE